MEGVCHWKLLTPAAFLAIYTAAAAWLLSLINVWTLSLVKETIIWFLFSGLGVAATAVTARKEKSIVKLLVKDTVTVIVLLEFLVGTYTFALWAELLLVPVVTIVVGANAVAQVKDEVAEARPFTSGLQALIGLGILGSAGVKAVLDFQTLASWESARTFALPIVLSLLCAPALYAVVLYARYDSILNRVGLHGRASLGVKLYALWRLIDSGGFSAHEIQSIENRYTNQLMHIETKEDVDRLMEDIET